MMKRLITFCISILFICSSVLANEEFPVVFDMENPKDVTIDLPYAYISFSYVYPGYHSVHVTVENKTISEALLLFRNSQGEKMLKKQKPKIGFGKKYPGSKGNRTVLGCKELNQFFYSIIPQEKRDICNFNISLTSGSKFELPIYLAQYNPKKLIQKGAYNVNYTILSEEILTFNIKIKTWSEKEDPVYIEKKAEVEKFIDSVKSAKFCDNPKHEPSVAEQQRPYQDQKNSLTQEINQILYNHPRWFSTDLPHQKYTELMTQLKSVDLNEHLYDCGEHKVVTNRGGGHSCEYCSLSAQQIYHQLDDIYQQLRAGKLNKSIAVRKAQGLYNCYQKYPNRKKNTDYSDKISKFYSRITSY